MDETKEARGIDRDGLHTMASKSRRSSATRTSMTAAPVSIGSPADGLDGADLPRTRHASAHNNRNPGGYGLGLPFKVKRPTQTEMIRHLETAISAYFGRPLIC